MTYVSPEQTRLDVGLQQAQMVAFAIPYIGPVFAAGFSIMGAVFDAYAGGEEARATYSPEQAIDDLGREVVKLLGNSDDKNQKLITKLQLLRAQTDGFARDYKADGGKADAATAIAALAANQDWKDLLANLNDDPAAIDRLGKQTFDHAPADCCTYFPITSTDPVMTADDVKFLATYVQGHTTYHAVLISTLAYIAVTLELPGTKDWMLVRGSLRDQLHQALAMAVDHLCKIVNKLEDAIAHADSQARSAAVVAFGKLPNGVAPGPDWLLPYTREYRRIRNAAFLDQTTPEAVTTYRAFIDAFYFSLANLTDPKNAPTIDPANAAAPPAPVGPPVPQKGALPPLGPRPAKTARFQYETSSTGYWVGVVENTALGKGLLVTQNAGSAKPTIYYKVDGGGLNAIFKGVLSAAGQLAAADIAVANAYDAKYGHGQFTVDSAASPTRQDRLTSFLVPLSVAGPIGDQVLGMVYSAAPDLGPAGLTDTVGYGKIYLDALTEISTWNAAHPKTPVVYFRITMLATSTNAGANAGAALNQKVAGIIVDAVAAALSVDAKLAKPVLQGLVVLVNNNEKAGSAERIAFDAAATSKNAALAKDGFDLTFT